MPVPPPSEEMLYQPEMAPMELFGRMRSLATDAGFVGILPAIWQCSDESQGIKKALFGYVFDCPVFNLGRVGALLDPNRLVPASRHGRDLVILGGSHLGAREEEGVGFVERVHGEVAPCCGMLHRVLEEYLQGYRRAAALITLLPGRGGFEIDIPYKYLFRQSPPRAASINLRLGHLVEGEPLRDSSRGKIYRLHPAPAARHQRLLCDAAAGPQPIGEFLDRETFYFTKRFDPETHDPAALLESSVIDFLPDIVTSPHPHRRLADLNTWRQFHRLASYLTGSFDNSGRNVLVVAGLTLDHSIRRNSFVPQFGFLLEQGRALEARYFGPEEINGLLKRQSVFRPAKSFFQYAGIGAAASDNEGEEETASQGSLSGRQEF